MIIAPAKPHRYKGALVVFEGPPGSGKSTQLALAAAYLRERGLSVCEVKYPRYGKEYPHGQSVLDYLGGALGPAYLVPPEFAAMPFLLNRMAHQNELRQWLMAGYFVLVDRGSTTNMAYQGAKFDSVKEQDEWMSSWYRTEYFTHRLVREDLLLYFDAPVSVSLANLDRIAKEGSREGRDGQEQSDEHVAKIVGCFDRIVRCLPYAKTVMVTEGEQGAEFFRWREVIQLDVRAALEGLVLRKFPQVVR